MAPLEPSLCWGPAALPLPRQPRLSQQAGAGGPGGGDRQALTVGIKPGSDPRDDPGEGMQGAPRVAQGEGRTRPICLGPRLPLQEVRAGEPVRSLAVPESAGGSDGLRADVSLVEGA